MEIKVDFTKVTNLFKKEIPKSEIAAMSEKVNIDEFFENMTHYYSPSELIRKLGGIRKFKNLTKDEDIYAAIEKRLAALIDTKLTFVGKDKTLVQFYTDQICPHEDQLKEDFWWTIFNGYGLEQIIYNEDGEKSIEGFEREEFWRVEPTRDLLHARVKFTSNLALSDKVLPWGKWVVTTYQATKANPKGEPMAERLIHPWLFKCQGWDYWMDFAKRFANGFLHAKITDTKKIEEFRQKLEKAGKSSILVTDNNSNISMIQASRESSLYTSLDDKTVAKIQRIILGETLTSGTAEAGSAGAAGIHNDVRLEKTRADIKFVEKAINQIVEKTAAVFGFKGELPKAVIIYDPGLNTELALRDTALDGLGVRFNKEYFEKTYNLNGDQFEVIDKDANQGGFGFNAPKHSFLKMKDLVDYLGLNKFSKCGHNKLKLAQDPIINRKANRSYNEKEELVQLMRRIGNAPISNEDLMAAIKISKTEKELDENLAKLFDQKNNEFSEQLTQAFYNAAAKGALTGNPKTLKSDEIEND